MRLKFVAIFVAALAVLSCGTVVYATSQPESPVPDGYVGETPAPADRPETEPTGAQRVATVKADLPALSRPRTTADRVSGAVTAGPLLEGAPANLGESRQVRRSDGSAAWIAPSSNGEAVCLIAPGELNCPPASEIAQRGAAVATFWHAEGPVRVTGIASSDVDAVEVLTADGSTVKVPVIDGSFLYESERAAREVRWVGPNGPETQALPQIPGRE